MNTLIVILKEVFIDDGFFWTDDMNTGLSAMGDPVLADTVFKAILDIDTDMVLLKVGMWDDGVVGIDHQSRVQGIDPAVLDGETGHIDIICGD